MTTCSTDPATEYAVAHGRSLALRALMASRAAAPGDGDALYRRLTADAGTAAQMAVRLLVEVDGEGGILEARVYAHAAYLLDQLAGDMLTVRYGW